MVGKVLFWSGFGLAVRLWQLGLEMRPFFNKESLWVYPIFAAAGGSFGYWLQGMESRQQRILQDRKDALLAKRKRRAEKEGKEDIGGQILNGKKAEEAGVFASTS